MNRISQKMGRRTGQEVDPHLLAVELDVPVERIRKMLRFQQTPESLDDVPYAYSWDEESDGMWDEETNSNVQIVDLTCIAQDVTVEATELHQAISEVLKSLTPRESKVISFRFGIDLCQGFTLEEVGEMYEVTRERIRQIESKALGRLQHPTRTVRLEQFVSERMEKAVANRRVQKPLPAGGQDRTREGRRSRVSVVCAACGDEVLASRLESHMRRLHLGSGLVDL